MFSNLTYKEEVESNPTYFKDMKKMYQKEWEGIRNPNNVFFTIYFSQYGINSKNTSLFAEGWGATYCGKYFECSFI